MPVDFYHIICIKIRWEYQLVILDNIFANMDLESIGYLWRNCRKLCLVEISSFQVRINCAEYFYHAKWFHCRLEGEAYIHYKSMLISLALHLILLMFELLVCDKLESSRHLWILVFIPLIFISIVSIAICIWAVKHDRSFEVSTIVYFYKRNVIYRII